MQNARLIQLLQQLPDDYEVELVFPDIVSMSSSLGMDDELRFDDLHKTIYLVTTDTYIPSDDGKYYGVPQWVQS